MPQFKAQEVGLYIKKKIILEKRPVVDDKEMVLLIMDSVEYFQQHIDYKEMFYALYLNNAGRLLSLLMVSEGSDVDTAVSPKQILQGAILQNATSIILVHNHPSGNVTPSKNDITLTTQIRKSALLFDIKLVDHVIMTKGDSYSFAEGF
jgi:DNA repair protein RadC